MAKFEVTLKREIRLSLTLEVDAVDEESARTAADAEASTGYHETEWLEESLLDERISRVRKVGP